MGLIWKSAMPLLPTLAALIIIVHCVEEDLETEYRHDLKPRILDTETSNYKSWRLMEEGPVVQKSRFEENWDNGSDDASPKRRRPGRKRKRRPQTAPTEESIPQERYAYPDEPPRPYYDVDFENIRRTTEMPKRRRKKPEERPIRWTDDDVMVAERPLRKNAGWRKKRPSLEKWPELSEFRDTANLNQEKVETGPEANPHEIIAEKVFGYNRKIIKHRTSGIEDHNESIAAENVEDTEQIPIPVDKSLSEFSMEIMSQSKLEVPNESPNFESKINIPQSIEPEITESQDHEHKNRELEEHEPVNKNRLRIPKRKKKKIVREEDEKDKAIEKMDMSYLKFLISKNESSLGDEDTTDHTDKTMKQLKSGLKARFNGIDDIYPTDQISLKDILKRSNGTSLSEILQQHNVSLSDLLHGKEHAVSLLKSKDVLGSKLSEKNITKVDIKEYSDEQTPITLESQYATEPITEYFTTTEAGQTEVGAEAVPTTTVKPLKDNIPKISTSRRYPLSLRKKLRIRPINNATNTFKGQLSRDFISSNSRKYYNFRRNVTKSRHWKNIIPTPIRNNTNKENNNKTLLEKTTTEFVLEETTISSEIASQNSSYEDMRSQMGADIKLDDINMDVTEPTTTESMTEITKNCTEKPVGIVTMARPTAISSGLRRQAFNNRLKRKRLKNKSSTTEAPQDDIIKHLFGMGNLVSSSEFIERTQGPKITEDDSTELSTLDDFITTERASRTDGNVRLISTQTTTPHSIIETTTKEAAKIEIEEIFSDTETRAKLSRILKERNMTLSELVELRERGSSHIHLADIFHNASREPNPAEPFLSKSLLEPISKETYPLRAILEANLHDPSGKVTPIDSNINIPVVMDFRNNVNENAENMGIMSLFNNFSKNITQITTSTESERNLTVNDTSSATNTSQNVRESRVLDDFQDDVVSWNEIFSIMGRSHNDEIEETSIGEPIKRITIEDADGDGLIALEDLEHLTDFDNIVLASKEKIDVQKNTVEKASGILEKIPSHTKSVTVATASIAGLAMVLFLLTYATYKWKQQKSMIRKRSFCDERIPTPVFEHRKGHKNNSSTRSISPMIQASNIYTLNTLDSQNGKESPDYMWDSLRKPFQ